MLTSLGLRIGSLSLARKDRLRIWFLLVDIRLVQMKSLEDDDD
jgi:hypothetical protein